MSYETLRYDVRDGVAELTLDQPEKRNPLNVEAKDELLDALEVARTDDGVRVLIITGAGSVFSAGGDINELTERMEQDVETLYDGGDQNVQLFQTIAEFEKPIITAVNGHAFGGGCGVVSASHIAYADQDAKFGISEIKIGTFPLTILPTLRQMIGDRKTLELALTGRSIDAREAEAMGLVTEAVSGDANALARARDTASDLAAKSPFAMQLGLRVFHKLTSPARVEAMDAMKAYRVLFSKSKALNEGASAFLEDRDPEW